MRFFETAPLKVLLIPLVPAMALGIVTLAATLTPPTQATIETSVRQPCTFESRRVSPPPPPAPAPCTDCRAAAPA